MASKTLATFAVTMVVFLITTPAFADSMRTNVAFNNGIGQKTADQPANGVKVAYQITLQGGDLDGCTVKIVESLYGRDEGNWGIFDIAGDVTCAGGGFAYTTSGAWDGKGFHAAGAIKDGSGTGDYKGMAGRVVQLNAGSTKAADGTFDISYELVVDPTAK